MDDRRLLSVHAHPDDEAICTAATMASYARQGATVVLVTCTRGEIVAPDLARLREADRAHRSQVDLENGILAILTKVPEFAVESYQLVRGERGPASGPYGWEDDLFAGLSTGGSG